MPRVKEGVNDLATVNPKLASEWDYKKNYPLTPNKVGGKSPKVVWWVCKNSHHWQAGCGNRWTTGCPYCSGRKVLKGLNDLATTRPDIAAMWDSSKNGNPIPDFISAGSNKKFWWVCPKGHSHRTQVTSMVRNPNNCPYCSGHKVMLGSNDFATLYPEMLNEWDYTKNKKQPNEVVYTNTSLKIWWLCPQGHSYRATVSNRTHGRNGGTGCPFCAGRRVSAGFNDLASLYPSIAKEWDSTRNNTLTPQKVTHGSNRRVWWMCPKGHSYDMTITDRTKKGLNCPVCSNRRVIIGTNDLTTTNPEVAQDWYVERNLPLTVKQVSAGTDTKVWWKCHQCGHVWNTSIYKRTCGQHTGCPKCLSGSHSSKGEREVYDFIESLLPTKKERRELDENLNSRRALPSGKELDIYLPSRHIAIEYNGLYWHDEDHLGQPYHYDKWRECANNGITLYQVWEDDWMQRREVVEDFLSQKLGLAHSSSLGARRCDVVEVDVSTARRFFDRNHVQGFVAGSIVKGLVPKKDSGEFNDGICALISLRKRGDGSYEIVRYASERRWNIQGGFSKLLKACEQELEKGTKIVTFSDHCVSDGGLYKKTGFTVDGEIRADYAYVVDDDHREHKFGYRLKRFRNDPALEYKEGLTERELAELNGLHRIWDAGKTRWVKVVL